MTVESRADVQTQTHFTGIDSLRAAAALAVFICHLPPYGQFADRMPKFINDLFITGAHGVDVFIVVSGFCLALPYVRRDNLVHVGTFYRRRALRIAPPYWVALAIASVLAVGPQTWDWVVAGQAGPGDVALATTFLQSWAGREGAINGSLWSVALEVTLYLVFPVLVLWWRRFSLTSLVLVSAAIALAWFAFPIDGPTTQLVLPARLIQFVIGMWCAQLVTRRDVSAATAAAVATAALVAGVAASTLNFTSLSMIVWGVAGGALCLLVVALGRQGKTWEPAERAGKTSYSFYLLHQPVILVFFHWFGSPDSSWLTLLALGMTAVLALTFGAGLLLYLTVERPSAAVSRRRRVHVVS